MTDILTWTGSSSTEELAKENGSMANGWRGCGVEGVSSSYESSCRAVACARARRRRANAEGAHSAADRVTVATTSASRVPSRRTCHHPHQHHHILPDSAVI